jgi:protocatechuate 3,4-dioxygenase beta subunit
MTKPSLPDLIDLTGPISRRHALGLLGVGALSVGVAACAPPSSGSGSGSCTLIPSETNGPYPADGSNGPNVLTQSGIVRSDIRSSFGSFSGTAAGVLTTFKLKVLDAASCSAKSGAAVYVWHCDRDGRYSLYSSGVTNQNYLRGVQPTGSDGIATFTSIFPACYSGRWPHVHIEMFPNLADATALANATKVTQLALPAATCNAVYATTGYSQSVTNLAQVSLTTDNVFGDDGAVHELGTVTGSVADGYVVSLDIPV